MAEPVEVAEPGRAAAPDARLDCGAQRVGGDRRSVRERARVDDALDPVAEPRVILHGVGPASQVDGRQLPVRRARAEAGKPRVVALGDRGRVRRVRLYRAEARGEPLGVVAREHLLVHVEEQLALPVLAGRAAAAVGHAAHGVDDVPVLVMLVRERVLAEPVDLPLAADRLE